jgi:hypothetical protein
MIAQIRYITEEIKVNKQEKIGGEGWRRGGSLAQWPLCKQGTWNSRRIVDFEHGEIGVSGPTTYNLDWDRAHQEPGVISGFCHLIL